MKAIRNTVAVLLALSEFTCSWASDAITAEGVIDAPIGRVWAAWTTPAGLQAWVAPHADIELRVGGLMRANYNESGTLGDAATIENKVLSFDPERMLSIQVVRAPEAFPFKAEVGDMWTVLYFQALPEERTRLKIVGLGFGASEQGRR